MSLDVKWHSTGPKWTKANMQQSQPYSIITRNGPSRFKHSKEVHLLSGYLDHKIWALSLGLIKVRIIWPNFQLDPYSIKKFQSDPYIK